MSARLGAVARNDEAEARRGVLERLERVVVAARVRIYASSAEKREQQPRQLQRVAVLGRASYGVVARDDDPRRLRRRGPELHVDCG